MRKVVVALMLSALVAACSSKTSEQRFLDEVGAMSKEEIVARGDAAVEKKHFDDARKYYSFVADAFPNDPLGRRAALKVADTFYYGKSLENLTEAQLRYKDFVNRFPNDPNRPYALLMLGKCSFQQGKGPERDLTPIKEALDSFRQLLSLYPDAKDAPEAKELEAKCIEDLANHELEVAQYYMSVKAWIGARNRLEYLVATYPESGAAHEASPLLDEVNKKLAANREASSSPRPKDR
jgi:outer membrane protein assembly factor BamD